MALQVLAHIVRMALRQGQLILRAAAELSLHHERFIATVVQLLLLHERIDGELVARAANAGQPWRELQTRRLHHRREDGQGCAGLVWRFDQARIVARL